MTRINVIPPAELCDQHLLAEFRELTRIPNGILSGKLKAHYDDRPSHVSTIQSKLLTETKLPRLRVLQLLNKIADAVNSGGQVVELSLDDARMILELGKQIN